jgi:CubicO group peptidase (beta-lactamase class C family)
MMLNQGLLGKERILARPTVEVMTTDQISEEQKAVSAFFPGFWAARGWGFGVSMSTRRIGLGSTPGRFGWDGAFNTSWAADPAEEMTAILMTQRLGMGPEPAGLMADFWPLVYQSIDD